MSEILEASELLKMVKALGRKPRHAQKIVVDAVIFDRVWSAQGSKLQPVSESLPDVIAESFRKWRIAPDLVAAELQSEMYSTDAFEIFTKVFQKLS